MAVIDNLTQAKLQVSNLLVTITLNPKPTYSVNGKTVSWETYYGMLVDKLENLNKLIQVEGGPLEFATQGLS